MAVADGAGRDVPRRRTPRRHGTVRAQRRGTASPTSRGVDEGTQLYVTSTDADDRRPRGRRSSRSPATARRTGRTVATTFPLPGAGHAASCSTTPPSSWMCWARHPTAPGPPCTSSSPTAKSVFADHRLPFEPDGAGCLTTTRSTRPTSHGAMLAFGADGRGRLARRRLLPFAWRLPGVILGALTVGVLYLLARILFRRRAVGGPRRPVRAARRDVLRPEPDRDERRLHRLLHPRRVPAVRVAVAGARAGRAGVLDADARDRACCWASRSPPSGSPPTRSARWGSSSSSARRWGGSCSSWA